MAKILLGPTIIGIRGTVAGVTFSANRAGPYARGWHMPPNPRSALQLVERVNLAGWSVAWRATTPAEKIAWTAYAAAAPQALTDSLGLTYFASGFNWYVIINTARVQMGSAPTNTPPANPAPAAPTGTSFLCRATASPNTTRWQFNPADPTIGLKKGIFAIVGNSIGNLYEPASLYYVKTANVDGSNQIAFQTEAEARWGDIVVGQKMWSYCYNISAEGRKSTLVHAAANATNP